MDVVWAEVVPELVSTVVEVVAIVVNVVKVEEDSATVEVVSAEVVPDEVSAVVKLVSVETVPEVFVEPVSIVTEVEVAVAVVLLSDEMVVPCGTQTPASTTEREASAVKATAINLFETITN